MPEKINIKSDEITEILGTPPRWIVRWGITIVFTVIAVVLVGSAFFQYPDTVVSPVIITAENPPAVVIARASGKPAALFVTDGQKVSKGDTLGVIDNPANYRDIFKLSMLITNTSFEELIKGSIKLCSSNFSLGEQQSAFNSFDRAYNELITFNQLNFHQQKVNALEKELKHYEVYFNRLTKQFDLAKADLDIAHKQFSRDSFLFSNKYIPEAEFENATTMLLTKKQALEGSGINLSNALITIERLRQTIIDTHIDYQNQQNKLEGEAESTHRQLVSSLAVWEKMYLLVSPSTGKLSFMSVWSDLQEVKAGDLLFSITPDNLGKIQGRTTIPFAGAGKVKPGQKVNIKLDGYSYLEFGMVQGVVSSVSSGYNDKGYPSLIDLPKGIETSYGLQIPFDRELHGIAEITTEEQSVLQRLFSPLKHLLKSKLQ